MIIQKKIMLSFLLFLTYQLHGMHQQQMPLTLLMATPQQQAELNRLFAEMQEQVSLEKRKSNCFFHWLNLVKCIAHLPSVITLEHPDSYWGKKALYSSQVALFVKMFSELFRDKKYLGFFNRDCCDFTWRAAKYLTLIGHQIDTTELLSKINDTEPGKVVDMPKGNRISQLSLLLSEMAIHLLLIGSKKMIDAPRSAVAASVEDFLGGEIADVIELLRLTLKQKHHSGFRLLDRPEEEAQEKTEQESISTQELADSQSIINENYQHNF